MPFDSSGNFTRDYNWVDDRNAGIKIESVRMDGEFDNYASAINQTLLRTGVVPMTGNLNMQGNAIYGISGGTLALPGMRFTADQDTGIASLNPGEVSLISNGTEIIRSTSAGALINGTLGVAADILVQGGIITNDGITVGSPLNVSAAVGTDRAVNLQTDGSNRWALVANSNPETGVGGATGSDFLVYRYNDAGGFMDTPLVISRVDGLTNINNGLVVTGNPGGTAGSAAIQISGLAATNRQLQYRTSGVIRWNAYANTDPETGVNNIGSNYAISRYTDGGVLIDSPLTVYRTNGAVGLNGNLIVAQTATFSGDTIHNGTAYFNANIGGVIPSGSSASAIAWNYTNGAGELDFWNMYTPAAQSFNFYQKTSPTAAKLLVMLAPAVANFYTDVYVTGNFTVSTNITMGGSLAITGSINVNGNITTSYVTTGGIAATGQVTITNAPLVMNTSNGGAPYFISLQYNGSNRFFYGLSSTPEGSGNSGRDFFIARMSNAGTYLDAPLTLYRTDGSALFSSNVNVAGTMTAANVYCNGGAMQLSGAGNTNRVFYYMNSTLTAPRWAMYVGAGETGSGSVGGDYAIQSYLDTGGSISAFSISRATGIVTIPQGINVPTKAQHDNSTNAASTAYVDTACNNISTGGNNATATAILVGPISTTSTAYVMAGMNKTITPTKSGRVMITVTGSMFSSTAPQTLQMQLFMSNVPGQAPPTQYQLALGNQLGTALRVKTNAANIWFPFSISWVVIGLTTFASYWGDLAFITQAAANAANLQDLAMTMIEL